MTTVQTLVRPGRVLPPPGFDDIGVNLLERIGDAFATGSKDASRLCSINRTFRTALSDRAFADKLCAQAHWPQAHDGICDAFERLLAQASHLPQRLRAEVMATVMAQLPERMRLPLPGLTSLLSALLQAIESLQDPLLQRESFLQLGKSFQTDYFRLQCFDAAAALGVKPSMNDFYRAFSKAGLAVLPGCVAAIAETTRGATPAAGVSSTTILARPSSRALKTQRTQAMHAEFFRMLSGGLFMVADQEDRFNAWTSLFEDPRCGSGDERHALLKGLSDELVVLADPKMRRSAFLKILHDVQHLSADAQPDMLRRLAFRLNALPDDIDFSAALKRLCLMATALPANRSCKAMRDIIRALPGILPSYRRAIAFHDFIEMIALQPPADRARIMPTLAARTFCLAEGLPLVLGYDALWRAVQAIDASLAVETVNRLIGQFDALPAVADIRQIRFVDLIDFARSVEPEHRSDLLVHLAERGPGMLGPELQMSAFHSVLDLVTAQPLSEQVHLLRELHQNFSFENFDVAVDDSTRFAMSNALGWVAARLQPQHHAEMLVSFADAALWARSPFMERQIRSVVRAAQRLPAPFGRDTLSHVSDILLREVGEVLGGPADRLYENFIGLLETADQLPTEMRVRLLDAIVAAVVILPDALHRGLRLDVQEHLHGLPSQTAAQLINALLTGTLR